MNNRNERRSLRLFLPLLLFAGFAASSAFGAPRSRTGRADQAMLATAAANVEAYDRCQDGTIDLSGAREGTAEQAAKFRKLVEAQAANYLVLHQACLAAIPGQERSCEQLRVIKGAEKSCREYVSYGSLVTAITGNGDARAVCAAFSMPRKPGQREPEGNPEKHAQKCDFLIAALRRGSSDVCGEAYNARIIPEEALAQCRKKLIYFDGVPDHCASDPDKVDEVFCRERATLLAGLRTKDFRTCALSPWCRAATSHKAEACDPYLVQADKLFCDQVAKVAVPLKTAEAARDAKVHAMAAKEKKRFKANEPMQVMDPAKLLKKPDESQGQ